MVDGQLQLFAEPPEAEAVVRIVTEIIQARGQPSAWELLAALEQRLGPTVRWVSEETLRHMLSDSALTQLQSEYLRDLLQSDDWTNALRGSERPGREVESTIDAFLRDSKGYKGSKQFQEMISFMANFREYAPFNNMLVKLQNPSCSFFATQADWSKRFGRAIKEDARPMLILAPMHPVMLVYDLDSTEGRPLPDELQQLSRFTGAWNPTRLSRTEENAYTHDFIRIDTVTLSSTNSGFATISRGSGDAKMRVALHRELDAPSRYGVLLHELAHIYLGHLGGDSDGWWPSRGGLARRAMEVEAEAVAYIVSRRAGLEGSSPQYVSRYLDEGHALQWVSLDLIAKVAGRLDIMATVALGKRAQRAPIR